MHDFGSENYEQMIMEIDSVWTDGCRREKVEFRVEVFDKVFDLRSGLWGLKSGRKNLRKSAKKVEVPKFLKQFLPMH